VCRWVNGSISSRGNFLLHCTYCLLCSLMFSSLNFWNHIPHLEVVIIFMFPTFSSLYSLFNVKWSCTSHSIIKLKCSLSLNYRTPNLNPWHSRIPYLTPIKFDFFVPIYTSISHRMLVHNLLVTYGISWELDLRDLEEAL